MRYLFVLLFICCMLQPSVTNAQHGKANPYYYDFMPGENVVFYDDFSGYKEGALPERWTILDHKHEDANFDIHTKVTISKIDTAWCLYFNQGNGDFAMPHWDTMGYSTVYKNNYWSIEFDFKFFITKNNSENDIGIISNDTPGVYWLMNFWRGWAKRDSQSYIMGADQNRMEYYHRYRKDYPAVYDTTRWHHFTVAITQHGTFGYIDRCKLIAMPYFDLYLPDLKLNGRAKVAIKNFRLARTDSLHSKVAEPGIPVSTLLTEHKLVTHAILFDRNKAVMKTESAAFINQLAGFLKANAGVKLYIDGHTDNDGTVDGNLKLSENRAEAVKKKLVQLGIAADRLQTRGYGATQPLENNNTPEGKAQNRRVEFIRL